MSEQSLKLKIQADISDLKKGMADASKEVGGFKGKMANAGKSIGSGFKTVAKGAAVVTGAVTGVGAGLFAMANKAAGAGDEIHKGASKIGVTTDAYQEMDYWASQNGLSSADMEKTVGRLNQRIGMALDGNEKYSGALERTGVSMDGLRDGTITTEDAFATSIQTLSEMENGHEKVAIATELFGSKLARELLPALEDGSLSFEEAKEQAAALGIVLDEDAVNASAAFSDSMDGLKRSMGAVFTKIGVELMPIFQELMDWVIANMPQIQKVISKVFEIVVKVVKVAVNIFKDHLLPMFKTVVKWVKDNWDTIQSVISTVFEAVKTVIEVIVGVFKTVLLPIFKLIVDWVKDNWDTIRSTISTVFDAVKAIFDLFVSVVGALWDKFGDTIMSVIKIAFEFISKHVQTVMKAIQGVIKIVTGVISGDWTQVWEGIKQVFSAIWEGIKNILNTMLEIIKTIFSGIYNTMKDKIGEARDKVLEIVDNIKEGFSEKFEAAKELVLGIFDGIRDGIGKAMDKAKELVGKAIDKIKGFFDFEWSLPKLKMPTFTKSGKFSLNPPSVPKFGISWNARGAIFKKPTVLGGGQGVGDASNGHGSAPEVVAPLRDLKQMLGLDDGKKGNTIINLNGSYGFRDKEDMDYFMNELALAGRRG